MDKVDSKWWLAIYQDIGSAHSTTELFRQIHAIAENLGFKHCCYGVSRTTSFANAAAERGLIVLDSYPDDWMRHYTNSNYLVSDPTVRIGTRSTLPMVWSDELFSTAPQLWSDAKENGLRVGVALSTWGPGGTFGLLSLARDIEPLLSAELAQLSPRLRWLVENAHTRMVQLLEAERDAQPEVTLSARESEVLSWTAEGKTSWEIGQILGISESTVNYHVKHLLAKLNAQNRIQAAVKALAHGQLLPVHISHRLP